MIIANAFNVKKDQTSAIKNVSSDQIEILPIENVSDILQKVDYEEQLLLHCFTLFQPSTSLDDQRFCTY